MEECGLPVTDEKKDSLVAAETNYLDLKKPCSDHCNPKSVIEQTGPPSDYAYAGASDYCLCETP